MDCFETEKIKFYNCDYKDILHQLTPKSIDLILVKKTGQKPISLNEIIHYQDLADSAEIKKLS
ncbi:hypothetical protein, partial [Campylobacter cuniculorum]